MEEKKSINTKEHYLELGGKYGISDHAVADQCTGSPALRCGNGGSPDLAMSVNNVFTASPCRGSAIIRYRT